MSLFHTICQRFWKMPTNEIITLPELTEQLTSNFFMQLYNRNTFGSFFSSFFFRLSFKWCTAAMRIVRHIPLISSSFSVCVWAMELGTFGNEPQQSMLINSEGKEWEGRRTQVPERKVMRQNGDDEGWVYPVAITWTSNNLQTPKRAKHFMKRCGVEQSDHSLDCHIEKNIRNGLCCALEQFKEMAQCPLLIFKWNYADFCAEHW